MASAASAAIATAMLLGAATASPDTDAGVLVEGYAFQPPMVTVPVGGTVTWTLGADPEQHTVTPVGHAAFEDSGNLFRGDTFEVTFERTGSWEYTCTLHPTMRGSVVVSEAAASVPEASPTASATAARSATPATPASAAATDVLDPGTPTGGPGAALPIAILIVAIALLGVVVAAVARRRRRS